MATFKDLLKKWFYQQGTQAAASTSRIPILDTNGNPTGCDTLVRIAALMQGRPHTQLNDSDDLDNIRDNKYVYETVNFVQPAHTPDASCYNNVIWVENQANGSRTIQFFYSVNAKKFYFRSGDNTSWSAWQLLSTDIPDFYKSYSTLAALGVALGVGSSTTKLAYYEVTVNKTSASITVDDLKTAVQPYFEGPQNHSAGMAFVVVISSDKAYRSFLINNNGFGFSAGILISYYDAPQWWKYNKNSGWTIVNLGSQS